MRVDKAKIRNSEESKLPKSSKSSRGSVYTSDFRSEYYNIQVEKLIPFKNQSRKYFDQESIEGLAKTIQEHGIRQPLTVLPSGIKEGFFEVVSGERRLRAAKFAGLNVVPCIIIHDQKQAEEIAIIENIQRKDLHPIELGGAYKNLLDLSICDSAQKIADKLGVHKSAVIESLSLLDLDEGTKNRLIESQIKNRNLLRELCRVDNHNERKLLIDVYLNNKAEQGAQKKALKKVGLRTKAHILNIAFDTTGFVIEKNKINELDELKKAELRVILDNLLGE
ncbi:Chromosome-partitioning protein Spo0J [Candidatus Arcanobacter lacustris]|uniref:Probable chromosome-partitioning protein ParB n=1 Tax=Candidatus Arcanibacter lacustris TaxID=1607817 RepID=A0A0F5MQM1_9RICK|nr:Chromosome-partitioning protein Spo0J [Candidatus Arcanobacter lacustris]